MKIEKYISNQRKLFNKDLKFFFDSYKASNILQQAMWYSLSNGGKRLRPILLAEVSKTLGIKKSDYLNMMLATELIPVSYTHLRSPRDTSSSRMPSSA